MYPSKKEGKDQESIQLSATPDPGYQWEKDSVTIRRQTRANRLALSQQVTTMQHSLPKVHKQKK